MEHDRRRFLAEGIGTALLAPLGLMAFGAGNPPAQTSQSQNPRPFPPEHENTTPEAPVIDPKEILKHNQKQITDDVQKLYTLAGELKEQVDKTDSATVLSLPLVQKAEAIEKLARQIKNLARG
jgi:hypothetical protein